MKSKGEIKIIDSGKVDCSKCPLIEVCKFANNLEVDRCPLALAINEVIYLKPKEADNERR